MGNFFPLIFIYISIVNLCLKGVCGVPHCVNCSMLEDIDYCKIYRTGYKGNYRNTVSEPKDGSDGMYDGIDVSACVPKKYKIEKLTKRICFWSPELGCKAVSAQSPDLDKFTCTSCKYYCKCGYVSSYGGCNNSPELAWGKFLCLGISFQFIKPRYH